MAVNADRRRPLPSLWLPGSSILLFLLQEFFKRVVGGFERGLAVVGLSLVASILAVVFAVLVWRCREEELLTDSRGHRFRRPCYSQSTRWGALVLAAIVTVLLILLSGQLGYSYARAWFYLEMAEPPRLELTAQPAFLKIGDELRLTVRVNNQPATDYFCEWKGEVEKWLAAGSCVVSHLIPPGFVKPDEPPRSVQINVIVRNARLRVLGSPTPAFVNVRYAPIIDVQVSNTRIFAGQESEVTVLVDGKSPTQDYRCGWTVNGKFIGWRECKLLVRGDAEPDPSKPVTKMTVAVEIVDGNRRTVARPPDVEINVVLPRNYVVFVLDASQRMTETIPRTAHTLLDFAKQDLLADIDLIDAVGGHVGIEVFGGGSPLSPLPPCVNSQPLVPLQPLNVGTFRAHLSALQAGQPEAPLLLGLRNGVESLARYADPGGRLYLITITGGLDTCRTGNVVALVVALQNMIARSGLQRLWLGYRLLTVTLALAVTSSDLQTWESWWAEPKSSEIPYIPIPAEDPAVFGRTLRAVTGLSARDPGERQDACGELMTILQERGAPETAQRPLRRFCENLPNP